MIDTVVSALADLSGRALALLIVVVVGVAMAVAHRRRDMDVLNWPRVGPVSAFVYAFIAGLVVGVAGGRQWESRPCRRRDGQRWDDYG